MRRLGAAGAAEGPGSGDRAQEPVVSAWDQYAKIAAHPDAAVLLLQIPPPAVSLLVGELMFMRGSARYHWRFEHVVRIFADFRALGRPLDSDAEFSLYLRALNRLGKHQQVISEVAQHCERTQRAAGAYLSMPAMRQVIAAYFRGSRPDRAMDVFLSMKSDEQYRDAITPHVYATVLRGALLGGHLPNSELYALIEELLVLVLQPRYDSALRTGLLNELLTVSGKSGNTSCFLTVFERFVASGVATNYTTFGILLRNACNAETDAQELHQIYRLIVSSEDALLQMNEHIFAMFIDNFVRHGRVDYALAAVADLRRHPRAQCTAQHLERVFAYYASMGMGLSALGLFREVTDENWFCPSWGIYSSTVQAVARDCNLVQAPDAAHDEQHAEDALLVALIGHGRAGSTATMLHTFALLRARFPESVLAFAALLTQSHQLVDAYTRNAGRVSPRVSGAMADGELRELVGRLRGVVEDLAAASSSVAVPQGLYHVAISLFALARDQDTAQRVYDHMTKVESMDPTVETFDMLLRSFARGSSVATAAELFKDLREQSGRLHRVTANILIRGFFAAGQPHQALDVYAYMAGRPTPLVEHAEYNDFLASGQCDAYTFALLISGLVDQSLLKEAVVVFEDSFAVLPFVPRQLLETLVSRLEERGMYDFAQLCLRRYSKRVEDSQPPELQPAIADPAPDHLPLSYFGYLLGKRC
ncbi:hypothetical protein LPJ61_002031 [Coemansia biformis]|uniref:Pentacotripeptide-repeat region of PRORP domain-containing protein n=1 Tax=Coemansia biformis TaxID=1286918 RepID=A0A9W8CZ17_9FUNG|nr:hypothetical protein LPJ61_002031 [Coemansia biformis]